MNENLILHSGDCNCVECLAKWESACKLSFQDTEWISVKDEEPPKDGTPFLCYDPKQTHSNVSACIYVVQFQAENSYRDSGFIETGGECYFEWIPTHWMPLPKPPKTDGL